ncbi:hypothetical protein [Rathayibacter tanaceti]|uniref:Secreted protein n=2 Tax=Rathayibacter tanaceti TaxID=1671680 RepID=A0AAE6RM28_9MICO|nr:hypothetical protein [Rathayibacter tanaceti]QHC56746.1 hypothetical protein GSU10_14660 [Rathayibacter tanaceti]TCO32960.1 hypothetical protein EV639_1152 [Rathayibacter tanaceti]
MKKILTITVAAIITAGLSGGAASATAADEASSRSSVTALQPADGTWVLDSPGSRDRVAQARADVGYAAGTTPYPQAPAYECLAVFQDQSGEKVVLRQGQSGESAFGYLHGLIDHGVEEQTIDAVVTGSAAGQLQANGRYLYGAVFLKDGEPQIRFETIHDRQPSSASPDSFELGVVTSYCKGPGTQDPEEACPQ